MKKILLSLLIFLPFSLAAAKDDSKYLRGAVPEKDGIITFTQTFSVEGKQQADLFPVIQAYVRQLVDNGRQDLRTRITSDDPATHSIVAKVEEIMTFKKQFLNWDHCYFRYLITAECTADNKVKLTVTGISYHYGFDQDGNGGEEYKAEEWISDKEAINKAGTKLYPRSGKFRRKTVDRVGEIFDGARAAFEQPEEVVVKKKTATVIE